MSWGKLLHLYQTLKKPTAEPKNFRLVGLVMYSGIRQGRKICIDRKCSKPTRRSSEGKTKNKKYRTIELDAQAISILSRLEMHFLERNENDYIVLNRANKPTEPSKFVKRINTVYINAELPSDISGAHILRRTFATNKFNSGARIEEIAEYIGELTSTVEKYYINKKATLEYDDNGRRSYVRKL